jgi:DNA excision repair protein ERCC-2
VQVRELVQFALREGDLGGERDFVGPNRALAGIRGHQRLQRSRPAGYQKEVRLCHDLETEEFILRVQGRIDGLLAAPAEVLLEEIKTVQGRWNGLAEPLHWAQVKCYGFMYASRHGLEKLMLRLTYLDLETDMATEFCGQFSRGDLAATFEQATSIYLEWVGERRHWLCRRDQAIEKLPFPFPAYRPGQRPLAVGAYRALASGGRLFIEAPTGIGKTIAVLFPALKAMGQGKLERIFYLTARTVGRAVAEKAFNDLRQAGARLRTLTLTARDKICFQAGQGCDPAACPFARGYYDRHKPAMRAALERDEISRPVLEAVGRQHQVCPFELSLDLSAWVDAVICDYNYVFDPRVYLRRHFGEEPGDYAFLVDEAHNLVERAREMFSASLDLREIHEVRRAIQPAVPRCARALSRLGSALRHLCQGPGPAAQTGEGDGADLGQARMPAPRLGADGQPGEGFTRRELPAHLLPLLETALKEAETWLAQNQPAQFRQPLLELFFRLHSFQRTAALYDERYVTICQPGPKACQRDGGADDTILRCRINAAFRSQPERRIYAAGGGPGRNLSGAGEGGVRLFCLDPSRLLRQALARGKAAVFFSATLTPLAYYRDLLGGETGDPLLQSASPFPPENLAVLMHDRIGTRFDTRARTLPEVAQAIGAVTEERRGNYIVYFPSYQYLRAVQEQFQALRPAVRLLAQRPGMSEAEREAFLAAFAADHTETLVGFAVMGGIFGEGIDLAGERLIGAIIVGVGLPQLCLERDLIGGLFQEDTGSGFDYAYTYPGMNRVLQATGRVIRSETDCGVVLLIDTRFAEPRYRRLFPTWWHPRRVRNPAQIGQAARQFWSSHGDS